MSKTFRSKTLTALAAGFVVTALPVFGQGVPMEGPLPTTATDHGAVQERSSAGSGRIEAPGEWPGYSDYFR